MLRLHMLDLVCGPTGTQYPPNELERSPERPQYTHRVGYPPPPWGPGGRGRLPLNAMHTDAAMAVHTQQEPGQHERYRAFI